MKKYIRIITVTIVLGSLLIPGITRATPGVDIKPVNPKPVISTPIDPDDKCRADTLTKEGMEMTCSEYETYKKAKAKEREEKCTGTLTTDGDEKECDKGDAEIKKEDKAAADTKAAAEKEAAEKEACSSASKAIDGVDRTCEELKAKREADCMDKAKNKGVEYKSCEEKYEAEKNRQGSGFKFNLNALALTSGGEKQGKAIFANQDYAKYGVVVGTLLRVTDILIMLIGSLAMITLIIAGIFMITNHGDEAWVTKGKTMMLYSILGILFALLSFAFVNIIQSALA